MRPTARFCLILFFFIAQSFTTAQQYAKVNINNVSTFVYNNGGMDYNINTGLSGVKSLKNSQEFYFYQSGFHWGGKVNSEIRVGGAKYTSSLSQETQNKSKVYRVRRNYFTGSLEAEVNDENKTEAEIRGQYTNDYVKWPVKLGAPFEDVDNDGDYTDGVDLPGYPGASQTLWYIANDTRDNENEFYSFPYNSKPTGIELQSTTWVYSLNSLLDNCVFKSFRIINRSGYEITDAYVGLFSDVDIRYASNDLAGCDTTLGLGYIYNTEETFLIFGAPLPMTGYALLKGPSIKSKMPLGMTSFFVYPRILPELLTQSKNSYHALQGLNYLNGTDIINPITKKPTKHLLSGNPVAKTGWVDGLQLSDYDYAGDKRYQVNSGPFYMAPGDTQEVVFVQIVFTGNDRLKNLEYLKYLTRKASEFYNDNIFKHPAYIKKSEEISTHYSLRQNYPNPFNPSTTIEYTIPKAEHITLKVFDVLGREVATLVDEYKQAGTYNSKFSIINYKLSSGVYFYQLSAGRFVVTKKLIILR